MKRSIGIDFGTTNTVVTFRDSKGRLKKAGGKCIRSAVYFLSCNEFIIGDEAIKRGAGNHTALVTNFKPEIKGEKYEIIAENGESFSKKPLAVARMFLNRVLTDYIEKRFLKWFGSAEMTEDDKTVITVPEKFNVEEKAAIKKAAEKAQFLNVSLSTEPSAAAIAYSDTCNDDVIAVYDFGGGTFDVSVIEKISEGEYNPIGNDGDKNLGGNKISSKIAADIVFEKLKEKGIDFNFNSKELSGEEEYDPEDYDIEDRLNYFYIKQTAEDVKISFSENSDEILDFGISVYNNGKMENIQFEVERSEFEECIRPLIKRTVDITRRVVDEVISKGAELKKIILAGGSSQIYLVYEMLKTEFEKDNIEIIINEDEVFDLISKGALIIAERKNALSIGSMTTTQFGIAEKTPIGKSKFQALIMENSKRPVDGKKHYIIDSNIIRAGEIKIECYEKDIKSYPNAKNISDDGISFINSYTIPIETGLMPNSADVIFHIDQEGKLSLEATLLDNQNNVIKNLNKELRNNDDLE